MKPPQRASARILFAPDRSTIRSALRLRLGQKLALPAGVAAFADETCSVDDSRGTVRSLLPEGKPL